MSFNFITFEKEYIIPMNNFLFRFLAIINLFLLVSCQSEIQEQEYSMQQTITKTSPLTTYLERVAMVETVKDNLVDKSSYCTIQLPYKVTVNNTSISINTTADYQKVEDNIKAYSNDNDIVAIDFPVKMVYYNYIEKVIENETDFNSLLAYWNSLPDLLSKIEGLHIKYPITITIYNADNQVASSIKVTSDQSFFTFVNNLKENQFIALSYPISVVNCRNNLVSIANNLEFEDAVKDAIDNCQANSISLDFIDTITKNTWKISYFYGETEKTNQYSDYVFVFKNDYTVTATKAGVSVTGEWSSKLENEIREFKISFDSNLLHQLDEDWKVFEFNNSQFRFRCTEASNDTDYYLYFEKK